MEDKIILSASMSPGSYNKEKNTVDAIIYTAGEKALRVGMDGAYYIEFDIDGMSLEKLNTGRMPHLFVHDSYSGAILGRVLSARREGDNIITTTLLKESDEVPAINQALKDIRDGFMPNVSAGMNAAQYEKQEEKYNGRPLYMIRKSEPEEISSVPIGAISTAALLSKTGNGENINPEKSEVMEMDEKEKLEKERLEKERIEKEALEKEKIRREAAEAERTRIAGITLCAEKLGLSGEKSVMEMISGDVSLAEAQGRLIDLKAVSDANKDPNTINVSLVSDEKDKINMQAEDFIVAKLTGNTTGKLDSHNKFKHASIIELGHMLHIPGMSREKSRDENARIMMMSTSDFPNILSSAMNKKLVKEYGEVAKAYQQVATRSDFNDFKAVTYNQLNGFDEFNKVLEGEEYGYVTMSDAAVSAYAYKYGVILPFTMECMVNDDLNAFERKYRKAFNVANRKECEIFFKNNLADGPTMSDGKALFHNDHNNTASTSLAAPTAAQLKKMFKLFAAQTGPNGETLGLRAKYVIMPDALRADYEELMSPNYVPTSSSAALTQSMKSLIPIYDPYVDISTSTKWYCMADEQQIESFVYGYLAGTNGPVIEQDSGFVNDTINYKFRLVFGARCLDWRGLTYNPGT